MKNTQIQNEQEQIINISNHALQRAAQRGIGIDIIKIMVLNGECSQKQGLKFFYMKKDRLKYFDRKMQDKLQNLVVIMAQDNTVITTYRNKKAIKNIKLKPKRLSTRQKYKN